MEPTELKVEIISVHLPKTAGTMFRNVLVNAYGEAAVFGDYKKQPVSATLSEIKSQNIKAIHGHFKVKKYDNYFPEAKRIIWLREPIKRLISNYWHQVTYFQKRTIILNELELEKKKFLNYAKRPRARNFMSRHFRHKKLKYFWFVGITEFFREDLKEIEAILGWPEKEIGKTNKHKHTEIYEAFVKAVQSDSEMIEQLRELNKKDVQLYNNALKLREERRKSSVERLPEQKIKNNITMTENPLIEILEIQKLSKKSELLLGFNIDALKKGRKIDGYSISITGWALAKTSPVVAVEILSRGKTLQRVPVGKPRPGVGKRFPETPEAQNSGFAAAVGVAGLPPVAQLRLRAFLADGTTVPLASLKIQHQPLRTAYQPQLQPLILTSSGRSGTTWCMRLLSQHPAIVTCQIYAYETRIIPFWMQLLQFLTQKANPLETPFGADYPPKAAAFCQQTFDAFYQHLAEAQNQIIPPTQPTYFAEKNSFNPNIDLLTEIYPQGKEIILVRDFRDVACSILAFNKKRGSEGFGRKRFKSDEEHLKEIMKNTASGLLHRWKQRQQQAYLVRYEDLILSPEETLTGIFGYLNLDNSPEAIANIIEKASADTPYTQWHQTSSSAKDSIGRWRQDLAPSLQKICNRVLADALQEFNYPPN